MATIDTPIPGKHEPWENYRGNRVEEYIKEQFDKKAGCFYPDNDNNKVLVFADEENRDLYLSDPTTHASLLIVALDIPSMYAAHIELLTPSYVAVLTGATGQYIRFNFSTESRDTGQTIPEDVYCTYTFKRGSHTEIVNARYTSGTTVAMNIDKYLLDGTNNITITITGVNTLASTTFGVVYKVINLALSDTLGIAKTYGPDDTIAIPYSIAGSGMKYMEWFIDGALQTHVPQEDEIPDLETTKTKYVNFSGLTSGVHTLQFRAYVLDNEERFYSQILYREFMVVTGEEIEPLIAVKGSITDGANGIVPQGERITFNTLTQYVPYELTVAVYNPATSITPVEVSMDSALLATIEVENYRESTYTITPMGHGEHVLVIKAGAAEAEFNMDIAETTMNIREITDGLVLDFSASGKTNADRTWSYGQYQGTFTGFKWNGTSGYNNNRLIIDGGSSFGINYAPFANSLHTTGLTLELEYSTLNVSDDNAVIMDLLTNGVGFKLTASEAALYSNIWKSAADSEKRALKKRFKSGETYRVTYVVNPYSGVSNHGLVFVYVNGRIGGAKAYTEADSFISNKELLFTGKADAVIALKQVRIYNTALSSDQVLNNYMLYRDTLAEMQTIYDANDVLEGDTTSFDPYALAEVMPVMLLTGNIPALENEYQDKKKQIVVDVEYINMQDPELSFTATNATLTPQGTSSMAYPKKNFRLYFRKYTYAVVLDWEGNEIESGLYSFKKANGTQKAAQPVSTWCTKADYAESSSSHNTGVARLWNKALYDAKVSYTASDPSHSVSNAYALRTQAQQAALDNGYEYDVRTCIDGFPICMFYRLTADSDYIFIGKYNFNNDKSTESVFGFKDIPGFDATNMQCWEVLDNSHDIALFRTVANFDTNFTKAFEARYPDDAGKPSEADRAQGALKSFCTWISGYANSAGGSASFATEKWEHLNVYMVAAYYIYLMTMGAVDQTTKNAMLTSEDGVHFYYINYDNDTILGVRNDGILAFPPTINRQSLDTSYEGVTVYAYAGHENTLWNMLEADTEFMAIARAVYTSLYNAGWNYSALVDMFDDKQSLLWCERVFNQDADYKYLTPYRDAGTDHLEMLQGSRSSHRRWWISKRLALYDSLFVAGEFSTNIFNFKCVNGTPANLQFSFTAGADLYYGFGIQTSIYKSGIYLHGPSEEYPDGETHVETLDRGLAIGDPISIYAGVYLRAVNISGFLPYLNTVEMTSMYSEATNTTSLKTLIIGNRTQSNTGLANLSGIQSVKKLEYLDIEGCRGLTSLNLSENPYVNTLRAYRTNIGEVKFADGGYITTFEAPSSLISLSLEGCPNITKDTLSFEDGHGKNIGTISIRNCAGLAGAWSLWLDWYRNKNVSDADCHVFVDGIDWAGVSAEDLISFGGIGDLTLRGKILISGSINPEQVSTLQSIFGENCFDSDNDLWIRTESDYIALIGDDSMTEGQTKQYKLVAITSKVGYIKYVISGPGSHMASIDENTGVLITTETGNATDTVNVFGRFYYDGGMLQDYKSVTILKATYPTVNDVAIDGPSRLVEETTAYTRIVTGEFTGVMTGAWTLTGDIANYATVTGNNTDCIVTLNDSSVLYANGVLSYSFYKTIGGTATLIGTVTKNISVFSDDLAVVRDINGPIMTSFWNAYGAGGSQVASRGQKLFHENYITKAEAASFTGNDLNPSGGGTSSIFYAQRNNITNFDEFVHFVNIMNIPGYCFSALVKLASIQFPPSLSSIDGYAFLMSMNTMQSSALPIDIVLPDTVTSIGTRAFSGCAIKSIVCDNVTTVGNTAFTACQNLKSIHAQNAATLSELSYDGGGNYALINLEELYMPKCVTTTVTFFLNKIGTQKHLRFTCGSIDARGTIWENVPARLTIIFSKYATSINSAFWNLIRFDNRDSKVIDYEVDPENTVYSIRGGCLCRNSDGVILKFPNNPGGKIEIPNTVTGIGSKAAYFMSIGEVVIPNSVTSIGANAFSNSRLSSVTIPSSITSINTAFQNCTVLKTINLDCAGGAVATNSFNNCTSIESLHIGPHFTSGITNLAQTLNHAGHNTITSLTVDSANPVFSGSGNCIWNKTDYTLNIGCNTTIIPNEIEVIGSYAFSYCNNLLFHDIPQRALVLKRECFSYAGPFNTLHLTSLVSGTSDATRVFYSATIDKLICDRHLNWATDLFMGSTLKEIDLGPNCTALERNCFHACRDVETIYIRRSTAPGIANNTWGQANASATGHNTAAAGTNILYVPTGATGYDGANWTAQLLNPNGGNFTIVYDPTL